MSKNDSGNQYTSTNNVKVNEETIKAYLSGKLAEEEVPPIEAYLASEEGERQLNQMMEQAWEEEDVVSDRKVFERVESNLRDHIKQTKQEEVFRWTRLRATMGIAASIVLLLAFGMQFLLQDDTSKEVVAELPMMIKETTKGLKSTVHLRDGSKVMLNSESKISYPQYFTDSSRVIHLEGEAFFEVAKDKSRPFTVIANGVATTALGTSFNINGRRNQCKVSLATGKVAVQQVDEQENYFLKPGQAVQFDLEARTVSRSEYTGFEDFLWTKGIIAFNDDHFELVIEKLSRWYNVDFSIENTGVVKQYTGRFDNKSLETILENMSFTLGFDYFIHEKKVKIIFEN